MFSRSVNPTLMRTGHHQLVLSGLGRWWNRRVGFAIRGQKQRECDRDEIGGAVRFGRRPAGGRASCPSAIRAPTSGGSGEPASCPSAIWALADGQWRVAGEVRRHEKLTPLTTFHPVEPAKPPTVSRRKAGIRASFAPETQPGNWQSRAPCESNQFGNNGPRLMTDLGQTLPALFSLDVCSPGFWSRAVRGRSRATSAAASEGYRVLSSVALRVLGVLHALLWVRIRP